MKRKYYIFPLMLAIWLGFMGLFHDSTLHAESENLFDQGEGYERGLYDRNAEQPTAFNWGRQSRFIGSSEHEVRWSFATADGVYSTPVIGADDTLYVGSYDGKLYALHSKTGDLLWSFETGFSIASSPAIGSDGIIYIGSGDGMLYALDPAAEVEAERLKWTFETGDRIYSSPAIGADGTIYITSYDGWIYALDPDAAHDERLIWSYELGGPTDSTPAIGADGTIYVGSGGGIFYALNPMAEDAHRLKWAFEPDTASDCDWIFDGPCAIYSSPAIGSDGTIYVGSDDMYFYALDPQADDDDDRVKWSFDTWGSVMSSPAIGVDGTVYVGSVSGSLYAFDPDNGDEQWSFDTPWDPIISSPVIGADGTIYIGSTDGKLYALDPYASDDKRVKWSFVSNDAILSSPIIGSDGTIYIGSYDSHIYALGKKPIRAPQHLNAESADSGVKLTWETVHEATGYHIYMFEGTAVPADPDNWKRINEELITEPTFTAENLTGSQLYWFAIKAVGAEGEESVFSEYVNATPYANITGVETFAPIQVAKGVEPVQLSLPLDARVQMSDGTEHDLSVTWDLLNTDYQSEKAGTYTFTGNLILSKHMNNPLNVKAKQVVNVLPSTNAKLDAIQLNGNQVVGFKPEIYTYHMRFPYETNQVTVTAVTYDPMAELELVGENPRQLQVGDNQIEIVVKAENGDIQQYTIHALREHDTKAPYWPLGSELNITNITETSVQLSWPMAFDNDDVAGYRLYVNGSVKADRAVDRFDYSHSNLKYQYKVTGLRPSTNYQFTIKAYDAAGNESEPGLSRSANTRQRSHSSANWYISNNSQLKTLEVWADGRHLLIEPSFTKTTLSYSVETTVSQIEVRASADHLASKVSWQGNPVDESIEIKLAEGENIIPVTVQAQDGSTTTYTLVVERMMPDLNEPDIPKLPEKPEDFFTDISGHWAENLIKQAAVQGIVNGYPDRLFQPNQAVTRAEFTVMLAEALDLPGQGTELNFVDRDQIGSWAHQAVAQAVQAGIIQGYEDGHFRPNQPITRAEMAVMTAKVLGLQNDEGLITTFADDHTIPQWAKGSVAALQKNGLIEGRSNHMFMPNELATRAEAVVMLLRMLS